MGQNFLNFTTALFYSILQIPDWMDDPESTTLTFYLISVGGLSIIVVYAIITFHMFYKI